MERTKRHLAYTLLVFLVLTLLVSARAFAGIEDSTAATGSALRYQPFSEAEISAAIQKPLTLDDCIRIALSKNISLRIAQGDLARAEATQAGSYSPYFPVFSLQGTRENTVEKRPVDASSPTTPTELSFDNQAVVAGVQQTLPTGTVLDFAGDIRRDLYAPDRFGAAPISIQNRLYSVQLTQPFLRNAWPSAARSAIKTARYDRQMQAQQFLNAKLQTIFAAKSAFYEVLYQRELIRMNQAAIQRDSTLYAASESKVVAKLATRRDVLSAEIQLASDKASLIKSESDYEFALDALKEVMGLQIAMPIAVVEMELSYAPVSLEEERLFQQALDSNPLLHSAEAEIDRGEWQLKVAKNQLLPQLDLIAGYSQSFEKETDQNIDLQTSGFVTAVRLSYPFLDRAAAASAQNAQIALSQQQDNLFNLKRQLAVNVRSIVRNTKSSIEAITAVQRSIEAAEQKVEFATTMFNLGRASNLDITDAQESLLKAQIQYVREVADYHIQLALLESLTGHSVTQ